MLGPRPFKTTAQTPFCMTPYPLRLLAVSEKESSITDPTLQDSSCQDPKKFQHDIATCHLGANVESATPPLLLQRRSPSLYH